MVLVDGKTIHFGTRGMSDYTKHKDKERMKRYTTRQKVGGNVVSKQQVFGVNGYYGISRQLLEVNVTYQRDLM